MSNPLKTQKTALITGASSGIGLALARHFAQDGYHLVLAARSVAKMQTLADRLHSQFQVDVTVIGADLGVWAAEGIARIEGSGMLGCNKGHECKLYPLLPATAATLTLRTARLAA